MRLGDCFPRLGCSIEEILIFIAHAGFPVHLVEGCLGCPWHIGFWRHIESVCAYMGSVGFWGRRVTEIDEQVGNVFFHCESASAFFIFPGEVYSCMHISFPIICDVVTFFEDIAEMMGMLLSSLFDAKVV